MNILPSSSSYEKINELWNMYAQIKNAHMYLGQKDLESYQINDITELLEIIMQDVLDGFPVELIHSVSESVDILW